MYYSSSLISECKQMSLFINSPRIIVIVVAMFNIIPHCFLSQSMHECPTKDYSPSNFAINVISEFLEIIAVQNHSNLPLHLFFHTHNTHRHIIHRSYCLFLAKCDVNFIYKIKALNYT